jgi:RNA polymerase sigma-70 factor (ECF subfamily)
MDPQLFNKGLEEASQFLAGHARRLTGTREEARDLVQDTVYKALRYRDKYSEETNFKGWVYTIMKNTFLNAKKREALVRFRSVDATPSLFNSLHHSAETIVSETNRRDIELAIASLKDEIRIPFVMSVAGFQYDEIAEEMGIPVGTVKSRIFRARTLLSEILREPVLS